MYLSEPPISSIADIAPPEEAGCALAAPSPDLLLSYGFASDPNLIHRALQQDAAVVLYGELLHPTAGRTHYLVAGVFDGVGGAKGGEIASGAAASALPSDIAAQLGAMTDIEQAPDIIREAVWRDNRSLYARSGGDGQMGTTVALMLYVGNPWLGDNVWVAHIGDSRAYALLGSDTDPVQVTRDHSIVQQRVDAGEITPEQALFAADGNLITAALGAAPTPAAFEIAHLSLSGQPVTLALMTDGVWGPLLQAAALRHPDLPDFNAYLSALLRGSAPQKAAARMVADALWLGSTDNAACVVVSIMPPLPTPAPDPGASPIAGETPAPDADLPEDNLTMNGTESEETHA